MSVCGGGIGATFEGGFETRPYTTQPCSGRRAAKAARALLLSLLGSLLSAPAIAATEASILAETLPSGARLVIQERKDSETFALHIVVLGGAAEDPEDLHGLSPLLAKMLLRGSSTVSASEQAGRIESTGSSLEARAGPTGISLTASGPASAFESVLDVVANAMAHAKLEPGDLAKEIALARQSLASARDDPSEALWRTALPLVYGSHPLGRVVDDPASYAAAIDAGALRRAWEQRFVGSRLIVVVVGGVDAASTRWLALAAFGALAPGKPAPPQLSAPTMLPSERRARARRRTSQPALLVAFPTTGVAEADAPALDLLNQILTGFQERLSAEIRERRGWAYWLADWDARYPGAGAFGILTAVPKKHLAETERLIRAELLRIASEPPSDEEVGRARRYLLTSKARAWQRSTERARAYATDLVNASPSRDYDELASRYQAVTPEAIRDLARRLFQTSEPVVVTLY